MELTIGCHLSSAKGYEQMGKDALSIGANTFQFFTRNPRGASVRAFDEEDAGRLAAFMRENGMHVMLAHAPYTMNACSADEHLRELAAEMMAEDLKRLEFFEGCMYNFHPGSHTGQGSETGIVQIAAMLNGLLKSGQRTTVLLETMAGKGSEVGRTFGELREILNRVELGARLGVCLDTCHVFDGGYDIADSLDAVLEEFDRTVGLSRLHAVHLNDSMFGLDSHKDRHARIGEGRLGTEAIARIINHPRLRALPFYLETPNELPGYAEEIHLLRGLYNA